MAITTDELRILLKINGAASYTTTMNQITNVTKSYETSVGKLIGTLTKIVTTGIIAKFSKQCIEAASNLQEVANVVNVTFGKTSGVVNDWAKQQAASFGLSETAAKRYLGTYGTMAKQFNFTTDQAAKMSIELTKLSGDIASFYNISDSSAATKLKAVFTGETESLKELGVVMTQTQLDAYAMANGWGKTTSDMTEQEKVALRYSYTLEKLGHAQGDFARTSDGYANSVRSLKLEYENLKVEIGNELLPVAAQGIQALGNILKAVSPFLINIAKTVGLYAEAWRNASEKTKTFAKISLACFGVMLLLPTVLKLVRGAIRLLTIDVLTLNGALSVLGILFAVLAFKDLAAAVHDMKANKTNEEIEKLSDSFEDLDAAINDMDNSTRKLDTFLASFDEVNKVGGGSTLASKIVNADDISNILDMASGIDGIQESLDNLSINIPTPRILTKEFWEEVGETVKGFIEDCKKGNFFKDWEIGADEFDRKLRQLWPEWADFYKRLGEAVYDALHPKEYAKEVLEKAVENPVGNGLNPSADGLDNFKGLKWKKYASGGYPDRGSLFLAGESGPELVGSFGDTRTRVLNQEQMGGLGGTPVIQFSPKIFMDGRQISLAVAEELNDMTRSGGGSPVIDFG